MMFTQPDFFTGKVLVKVPIGDMTDTLCLLGRLFSAPDRTSRKAPALNPTVNNHTLYGVVLSNRGVDMRKPPAKKISKKTGGYTPSILSKFQEDAQIILGTPVTGSNRLQEIL